MSLTDELNLISDKVFKLEQENEELRQQLESAPGNKEAFDDLIKQHREAILKIELQDKLIDLLTEDIEWYEKHLTERTSQKMKDIVAAYRAVRPRH